MANESATRGIVRQLGIAIKERMPELSQVLEDWPGANEVLKYPCLSIQGSAPRFTPCAPYLWKKTEANEINRSTVLWVNGQYEFNLQLDLWARSKAERHLLFENLQRAFTSQFPVNGLSLTLSDYFNVMARYDIASSKYEDSEQSSQRREWRAIVDVSAHCHSIFEKVENIISVAVAETETTDEILNN